MSANRIAFAISFLSLAAFALPNYDWAPGQHLEYEVKQTYSSKSGKLEKLKGWSVFAGSPDEYGKKRLYYYPTDEQGKWGRVGYVEYEGTGRFAWNYSHESAPFPSQLLPPLPTTYWQTVRSWNFTEPHSLLTHTLQIDHFPVWSSWKMTEVLSSGVHKSYEAEHKTQYRFSPWRGYVHSYRVERSRKWPVNIVSVEEATLKSKSTFEGSQLAELEEDASAYFHTLSLYQRNIEEAIATGAAGEQRLAQAEEKLLGLRRYLKTTHFQRQFQQDLNQHERTFSRWSERVARVREQIGTLAPRWELESLSGEKITLEEQMRPTVLAFWFRACQPCLGNLGVLEAIKRDFGNQISVIGMNVDRKLEDAQAVEKLFPLSFPNVQARSIKEVYGVVEYPTILVLDKQMQVQRIERGDRGNLRARLSRTLRKLLAR